MGAVAEFERNRISEQQKDAKVQAIAERRYTGGRRKFGYRIVVIEGRKRLVEEEVEQSIPQFIRKCNHLKLRQIQDFIR